ncbi:ABC transporter permease subunit [Streptomyces sp. NPDC012389]|uniref:ABC transporter permease subunit n=1 Tax=unclassified Streptomyces TaxID=2593676 RepID=UPI00081E75DE|nr:MULTISPECIES: ABC transporter permease subunit [unclassified Streptomyces]MYR96956.1 ABC transporter permease subunit [Streptomyces sp. SID4937]SCE18721.1 ABC-type transport system involved in multi-copper enzyme maturation, permease component [Streptomyces sp. ScaeMP-e83]
MTTPAAPQAHQQPQPEPPHGLLGYYESPIPIRRATLGDAIASEWTKIRSVRSTLWTLGVMIVLMVAIGLMSALLIAAADTDLGGEPVVALGFFGVLLGSICVITLGVLTIGSEYSTGMIRTTLTACPSRARVLTAKAIVFFLLAFTITTVTATVVAVAQTAILDGGVDDGSVWLRATVGVGLYIASLGLLSLAVGAIIRHSAGAITVMIAVVLLPLVLAMFMFSDSLRGLQRFLFEYSIPNQLGALYGTVVTDSGPSGWEPLLLMLGIAAVAMGGAYLALDRRDV